MIDSHAHIYAEEFDEDLDEVMSRAQACGVTQVLMPNIDIDSISRMNAVSDRYGEMCKPMMGLHPCSVKDDYKEQLLAMKAELDTGNYIAVGEIGTDLYWDKTFWVEQQDAFITQVQWAQEADLPIVIHCRESIDETIDLLKGMGNNEVKGVFHCFTGDSRQAKEIQDLGFYLGIGGVVTFKNGGIDKIMKEIPPEKVLLETDSPYLSPTPYRGKRNEPMRMELVRNRLAEIWDIKVEEVDRITEENTQVLFGLNDGR